MKRILLTLGFLCIASSLWAKSFTFAWTPITEPPTSPATYRLYARKAPGNTFVLVKNAGTAVTATVDFTPGFYAVVVRSVVLGLEGPNSNIVGVIITNPVSTPTPHP